MRLGVGGMVGDHGGPVSFMEAFHPAVQEWEKEIVTNNEQLLTTEDPITKKNVDIGIATYVDDIHAKHVINSINRKAHEPIIKLPKANEALDSILGGAGYVQNRSKQESVPVFTGAHTKYKYRYFTHACSTLGLGKSGTDARYLGVRVAAPRENKYELKCRMRAILIGWKRMGSFWTTK